MTLLEMCSFTNMIALNQRKKRHEWSQIMLIFANSFHNFPWSPKNMKIAKEFDVFFSFSQKWNTIGTIEISSPRNSK